MSGLSIFYGDNVLLKSKNGRDTVCIAIFVDYDDNLADDKIRLNKVVRKNLKVDLGDVVSVHPYPDIPDGNYIHISPIDY